MRSVRCLCLVLLTCLSVSLALDSIVGSDGYEAFGPTPGSRYKLYAHKLTWVQAVSRCRGDGSGAHLVTIDSQDEADVVKALFARIEDATVRFVFVGINDFVTKSTWVSIEGWPVLASYNKWAEGEPNNSGDEHCGTVTRNAEYNDFRCFWTAPFVCEKPVV